MKKFDGMMPLTLVFADDGQKGDFGPAPSSSIEMGTMRGFAITTGVPIHPDCVAAVQHAAKLCAELGHEVTEGAPTFDAARFATCFLTQWSVGCARAVDGNAILLNRKPAPSDCGKAMASAFGTGPSAQ